MREIELKEIQIKSQENLILRRNKEIEEYKQKENNHYDGGTALFKKIQNLENEKENFVKENLNLMNCNISLSNQIKNCKEKLGQTLDQDLARFSRIDEGILKDYEEKLKVVLK